MVDLVLIDWFSATSVIHTPQQIMDLLGMSACSWSLIKGAHGYKQRYYYNCISIFFDGSQNMGVWLEMSGQGCRCFEDIGHGDFEFLFQLVRDNPGQVRLTRLDIAYDDHTGVLDMPSIVADTLAHNYVSPSRSWDVTQSNKGTSVTIGSHQSPVLIRIYDKAAERNRIGEHWIRCELQLRDERAVAFSNLDMPIGEKFCDVILRYLRYVVPVPTDPDHRERWPLTDYWADLLGSAVAISIYAKPGMDYNLLKAKNLVFNQYGNSIDAVIQCIGVDTFLDELRRRRCRPNPKYTHMVEEFLRSCEDVG